MKKILPLLLLLAFAPRATVWAQSLPVAADTAGHFKTLVNGVTVTAQPANGGVPTGGTTGQTLVKNSNTTYDYSWTTGGGGSGTINAGTVNNLAYYSGSTAINSVSGSVAASNGVSFNSADTSKTFLGLYNSSSGAQNWEIRSLGSAGGTPGGLSFFTNSGFGQTFLLNGSTGAVGSFFTNTIDLGSGTLPTAGLPSSAVPAIRIAQANSSINGIEGLAWNGVTGLYLLGTSAGGTRASPTATVDGTAMSVLSVRGHNGTSYTGTGAGGVVINADGTWSGSNQGTKINILGTANGQTSGAVWFTLQNGSLQLPLGGYRSTGPTITDANPLAALAIDVTKGLNTKTVAVDSTFTFSAAPAVSNTYFTLRLTNSDTNPHVITIPSTFDSNSQQTITTFNILAGGVETVTWCYDGTNYIGYGVPTSGSSAEVTVASATTTAIGAASSVNVAISGTTAITGFGTVAAGTYRVGRFTGILTLTYNASSMILPNGGSNITTAAGDTFGARSEGSGNWRVLWYQPFTRASGSGTVTATGGSLTANSVVLGAGTTDTKVVAGITTDGTSKVTLGVAGTSVGSVDFKNATSGTATLAPPSGALGTYQVTLPNAASTLPIFGQQITFAGPTAARTITVPDAAFTVARTDAANTFTGIQTFSTVIAGTSGGTGVNNSTRTMTYAGNVAFTGAFNVSFTVPGAFTYTLPGATDTLVGRTSTDTLTNKRVTARVGTVTSSATPTINTDNVDMFTITAQAAAITSMTTNLSGTPAEGDQLLIRFKDNGTAQTIAWGTSYQSIGGTLPTTTVLGKILYVLLIWNVAASKWDCVSTSQQ